MTIMPQRVAAARKIAWREPACEEQEGGECEEGDDDERGQGGGAEGEESLFFEGAFGEPRVVPQDAGGPAWKLWRR